MYVLLRLLGDGKLYAADENVQKIKDMYFPILKIIREELLATKYEYSLRDKVQIYHNDRLMKELPAQRFSEEADYLYGQIIAGSNRAFAIARTEAFMQEMYCNRLAAPSSDKTDITMQIRDVQTGYAPICGFSIKSEVGNAPTLINATGATNFIFEVTGLSEEQIDSINAIETKTKIKDRMQRIFSEAEDVAFERASSDIFDRNLLLIDSRLTELVAHALVYHYRDGLGSCAEVVEKLEMENPMQYPTSGFYAFKFKKLLCSAALGMTPAKVWDGVDEANGGYIIVTACGEVMAYHIYNRAFFEQYLLKQTKFERGSTTRHGFASLYREHDKVYMKLNLQIRFRLNAPQI